MFEHPPYLVEAMLTHGIYLRKSTNHQGKECWRVMAPDHSPLYQLKQLDKRVAGVLHVKKSDKQLGCLTVNKHLVRALHGNNWLKKLYVKLMDEKGKCKPVSIAKVLPKKRA